MGIQRLLVLTLLIVVCVMPQAAQVAGPPGCAIMTAPGPVPGNVCKNHFFPFITFTHSRAKGGGPDRWQRLSQDSASLPYFQSQLPSHDDGVKRAHLDVACITAPPEFRLTLPDKFPAPSPGP